jgi:hypothetical protein
VHAFSGEKYYCSKHLQMLDYHLESFMLITSVVSENIHGQKSAGEDEEAETE